METHKSRLLLLCRFCGEQSIDLKRKNPKVNINFHVKLNDYYFGDDDDGIHPPNLCLKCKRKLELALFCLPGQIDTQGQYGTTQTKHTLSYKKKIITELAQ